MIPLASILLFDYKKLKVRGKSWRNSQQDIPKFRQIEINFTLKSLKHIPLNHLALFNPYNWK